MGDGEVAAGRHRVEQAGHDRVRVVAVGYAVEDRDQRNRRGLGEVQQFAGLAEDRGSVAEVSVDVVGGSCPTVGEQRARERGRLGRSPLLMGTAATWRAAEAANKRITDALGPPDPARCFSPGPAITCGNRL